jgi:5-methylcytosine-specific restriction protein B
VRWLWSSAESLPIGLAYGKSLIQKSIYRLEPSQVKWDAIRELLAPGRAESASPNCVLVIDEINRANLAKTFGELITLLEPSKRLGQADEQEAELPYSGDMLGVPPNLYVIGTMNTADRSIALMDTALRRRFQFREMNPDASLLSRDVEGIDLQALLLAMNARIEALFDRDHLLGHAYLMGVTTFDDVVERFHTQVIPLLQEYFFDDWRKIQKVFRDVGEPSERQIIQDAELQATNDGERNARGRYQVNPEPGPAAIQKIYA